MNASPRQRSSRRPSSHIRPQAVPVPSTLEYQSESSSIQPAMPDGLQIRPRIGGRSVNQVDHLHAAVQEPVVARVPLGHRRVGPVRRERQPLDLPGRLVQRAGGARVEVQSDDVRRVPPGSSRWIDGCDRDGQSISVPIDLPDVRVGRPDLRAVAGRQVEHEQAAARFSRAQDRGVGRRPGAVHRARAPVQPVAARDRPPGPADASPSLDHATDSADPTNVPTCTGSSPGTIVYGSW